MHFSAILLYYIIEKFELEGIIWYAMEAVCLTLHRQHSDVLLCKGSQPFHDRATGESLEVAHCQTNLLDDIQEMLAPLPLEQAILADCPSNSQDPQSCTRPQTAGLFSDAHSLSRWGDITEGHGKPCWDLGWIREVPHPHCAGHQVTYKLYNTITGTEPS